MNLPFDRVLRLSPDLASLADEARAEGFRHLDRLVAEWRSGENRFSLPGERCLAVRDDRGQLVGVGGLNVDPYAGDPLVGRIRRLFVRPEDRGRGHGRRLLDRLVEAARGRFRWVRVRTSNAGGFFERAGFDRVEGDADATHVLALPASRYSFAEPCTSWPARFDELALELRALLGANVDEVYHVGSTAVPGLAAKPIIDVLPVVREIALVDSATPDLEAAGFRAWGEYGLPGRRYFTRDRRDGVRLANVHVYEVGDVEIARHLDFRDHLRVDPADRAAYESLKRRAHAAHPEDIAAYNDAKDAWIKRVERR